MKRIIAIFLIITLLAGCSKATPAPQKEISVTSVTEADVAPVLEETETQTPAEDPEDTPEPETDSTPSQEEIVAEPEPAPQPEPSDKKEQNTEDPKPQQTSSEKEATTEPTQDKPQSTPAETKPQTNPTPKEPTVTTLEDKKPTESENQEPQTTKPSTSSESTTSDAQYPAPSQNDVLLFARNAKTIFVGETNRLEIFYFGSKKLSWYSSHPKCLTVDQSGNITPIYEGNYTVYVTDGTYTAEAYIFAAEGWGGASGIYFDTDKLELVEGKSTLLTLNGVAPGSCISYSSSNPSVVEISGNYITAVAPGTAIITAKETYGESASLVVTVIPNTMVVDLSITEDAVTLYDDESVQLNWNYTGSGTLEWSSSNSYVARVEENGLVVAVGEGSCRIFLSDGTYADECAVTVSIDPNVKVQKLTLASINGPMYDGVTKYKGDYISFQVDVMPHNASDATRVTSSDSTVVSVSRQPTAGGAIFRLDFKKAGTATIQVISGDDAVTNTYTIHVKDQHDCYPGSGQLTPEQFAYCYNQVLQDNGMSLDYTPTGYLVLTLRPQELTWAQARKGAEGLGHHWWSIGYRHMLVTFEGINEDGNYVFYERGCT